MIQQEYCSEIQALIFQFISAFDDGRIIRTDGENTKIVIPRWICSGKTPVFTDIINKAGNITLPVVVVEPASIKLDEKRKNNVVLKQYIGKGTDIHSYKQPTPISITLNVNFYSKFFNDLWQMFSNFAAYSNPVSFISWSAPHYNSLFTEELRTNVKWDGNYSIEYPTTFNAEEKPWLIVGKTTFTLEGFIFEFPSKKSKLITTAHISLGDSVSNISIENNDGIVDYYRKDGFPSITNFIGDGDLYYKTNEKQINEIPLEELIIIEGRSFFNTQCTGILIVPKNSDERPSKELTPVTIQTIKMGEIFGYAITESIIEITENIIKFELPVMEKGLIYDIIVYNNAGYVSLYDSQKFHCIV